MIWCWKLTVSCATACPHPACTWYKDPQMPPQQRSFTGSHTSQDCMSGSSSQGSPWHPSPAGHEGQQVGAHLKGHVHLLHLLSFPREWSRQRKASSAVWVPQWLASLGRKKQFYRAWQDLEPRITTGKTGPLPSLSSFRGPVCVALVESFSQLRGGPEGYACLLWSSLISSFNSCLGPSRSSALLASCPPACLRGTPGHH